MALYFIACLTAREIIHSGKVPKMFNISPIALSVESAFTSFILAFPVYYLLTQHGIIDRPNERSSHELPTARGGGIAFLFAGFLVISVIMYNDFSGFLGILTLSTILLGIVSFIDDIKGLPAFTRLAVQGIAAFSSLAASGIPDWQIFLAGISFPTPLLLFLGWVWIIGYTNAFNFMDGINGLASGQAIITGFGMALIAAKLSGSWTMPEIALCLIIAGSAAGFLPHNFPKARMFMGDVGSASLGFLLSSLCVALIKYLGPGSIIPLVFLHLNFILDTGVTLFRRIARGDRWYSPHREHFYQRLIRSGKSHTTVTLVEMALALVCCALILTSLEYPGPIGWLCLACCPIVWGVFFIVVEREFIRTQAICSHDA